MTPAQQLQETAQAMIAAAECSRSVLPVLELGCPHVYRQIVSDGKNPGLLSLWGRSCNIDENVGQVIVHPAILHGIGTLAGVPMRGQVVHAGLEHTYGYLFSTLETPYGAKRDRWLSPTLAQGFGIDLSLLSDRPREGTLLANVTWFMGQIAFRDRPALLRCLEANAAAVAPALVEAAGAWPGMCRLVEEVVLPGKTSRSVSLLTDLVPFPHPPADRTGSDTLLVYSTQTGQRGRRRLITAFPLRPEGLRELQASVPQDGQVEVRPHYNAAIPGWPERAVLGRRYWASLPG